MKGKPVFKNVTKGRIQIIQRGIPHWMNPGDIIIGERFRAFLSLGLKEVGREGLPQLTKPRPIIKAGVNDDKPEDSPIKVRKIRVVDSVMPVDDIKMGGTTDSLLPTGPTDPEPVVEEPAEAPEEPTEAAEEVAPADRADGPSGETLKAMLISELEEEPELALSIAEDPDDELIVIEEEEEEEEEVITHPYVCEKCDRGFASKRGLKSHLRSHK